MTTRTYSIWQDPPAAEPASTLHDSIGGHPLVAQLLAQRGIHTPQAALAFLDPRYYTPAPAEDLPDLTAAADHLLYALGRDQTILVWGDFDVDGQTATALLVDALRRLGGQVVYYIPDRLRESHGIRLDSLAAQIDQHRPALLLTCDTGISAHASLDYAKSKGVVALVTDHHDLPPALPDAAACVNPRRLPAGHALASLPGVGVAYKLVDYLYTLLGRAQDLPEFLDLAALGIVADVAHQSRDTRYLLQLGLDRLRTTQRLGLRALIEVAGLAPERLSAADIAFQLGPRLNAAGRLADARPVVDLFTTGDPAQARLLAAQLEGLNNQRRLQDRQIYAAAQEQIAADPTLLDFEALVLDSPAWHPGILGIVANRLAEHYRRPVVLLNTADETLARGSARSVPGCDIGAAIAAQAELLQEYGGHPGAAGLTLPKDNILLFRRRLSNTLEQTRDRGAVSGLQIDAYLPLTDVNLALAAELDRLAPFGEGNPPVTLASCDLRLKSAAFVDRARLHRRLTVEDTAGAHQSVFWWNSGTRPLPEGLFDLAYQVQIRARDGFPELELTLVDVRTAAEAAVVVEPTARQVMDLRAASDPRHALATFLADHPGAAVWAEGYRRADSPGRPLAELPDAEALVIYTAPHSPQALQEALSRRDYGLVALIAALPPLQGLQDIQRRLLELVKYVLRHQEGQTTVSALAAAVGQSSETIRLALEYDQARGEITVTWQDDDRLLLTPGDRSGAENPEAWAALRASVAETAAYRAYFRRADPHHVLGWDENA